MKSAALSYGVKFKQKNKIVISMESIKVITRLTNITMTFEKRNCKLRFVVSSERKVNTLNETTKFVVFCGLIIINISHLQFQQFSLMHFHICWKLSWNLIYHHRQYFKFIAWVWYVLNEPITSILWHVKTLELWHNHTKLKVSLNITQNNKNFHKSLFNIFINITFIIWQNFFHFKVYKSVHFTFFSFICGKLFTSSNNSHSTKNTPWSLIFTYFLILNIFVMQ